jgi:hypothetical protein
MKRLINIILAYISPKKERKCEWCKKTSYFRRKHIWCEVDRIGKIYSVCDDCIKTCKKS